MIVLENINKTYHNGAPLHVLKGIDLEIGKGELVSIMGASGSGKSTLLNILGILDDYDTGKYFLNGRLIKHLSETQAAAARNNMIGYIFQSFNLINYKNAVENVALPLYYQADAALLKYRSAEKALNSAQVAFRYEAEKYAAGRSTTFDYNDAKTRMQKAESDQIQAKYEFIFRTKILDFYAGFPLTL